LTGLDGLLKQFTESVLETALNEEMTEHLGYAKHRGLDRHISTSRTQDHLDWRQAAHPTVTWLARKPPKRAFIRDLVASACGGTRAREDDRRLPDRSARG